MRVGMRVHLLQQDRLFTIKSSQEENGYEEEGHAKDERQHDGN